MPGGATWQNVNDLINFTQSRDMDIPSSKSHWVLKPQLFNCPFLGHSISQVWRDISDHHPLIFKAECSVFGVEYPKYCCASRGNMLSVEASEEAVCVGGQMKLYCCHVWEMPYSCLPYLEGVTVKLFNPHSTNILNIQGPLTNVPGDPKNKPLYGNKLIDKVMTTWNDRIIHLRNMTKPLYTSGVCGYPSRKDSSHK